MQVECPNCEEPRELTRDRGALCKTCAVDERRKKLNPNNFDHRIHIMESGRQISQYLRICECGDEKWVGYIPRVDQDCRKCSSRKLGYAMSQSNFKDEADKTLYEHICTGCGKIRMLTASTKSRKTTLCGYCSRSHTGKTARPKKDTNMKKPRQKYYAYCDTCDEHREVQGKKDSGDVKCIKHKHLVEDTKAANVKRLETLKANGTKLGRKKDGTRPKLLKRRTKVSKEAIELERLKNRDHKKAMARKAKPVVQRKTEEQMKAEYLETHTVVTQGSTEPIERVHFTSGNGIVGTSVMS